MVDGTETNETDVSQKEADLKSALVWESVFSASAAFHDGQKKITWIGVASYSALVIVDCILAYVTKNPQASLVFCAAAALFGGGAAWLLRKSFKEAEGEMAANFIAGTIRDKINRLDPDGSLRAKLG